MELKEKVGVFEMEKKRRWTLHDLFLITVGSCLLAIGVTWLSEPNGLVAGGVTGLAIVIKELTGDLFEGGVPLWVTNVVLNIPLFVISICQRGFRFAEKSLLAVILNSIAFAILGYVPNPFLEMNDVFLGCIFAGVFAGAGMGMVLRAGATTGGTDMLAAILKKRFLHLPVANIMLFLDALIICVGAFVFGIYKAMYAIILVVICSYMINTLLEGMHFAKVVFIISDKTEEISKAVFRDLNRGNTGIKARGMFTGQDREILFVVVARKQIGTLRTVVREIDKNAFVTIADAKEVLGQGFIEEYDALTS